MKPMTLSPRGTSMDPHYSHTCWVLLPGLDRHEPIFPHTCSHDLLLAARVKMKNLLYEPNTTVSPLGLKEQEQNSRTVSSELKSNT